MQLLRCFALTRANLPDVGFPVFRVRIIQFNPAVQPLPLGAYFVQVFFEMLSTKLKNFFALG